MSDIQIRYESDDSQQTPSIISQTQALLVEDLDDFGIISDKTFSFLLNTLSSEEILHSGFIQIISKIISIPSITLDNNENIKMKYDEFIWKWYEIYRNLLEKYSDFFDKVRQYSEKGILYQLKVEIEEFISLMDDILWYWWMALWIWKNIMKENLFNEEDDFIQFLEIWKDYLVISTFKDIFEIKTRQYTSLN